MAVVGYFKTLDEAKKLAVEVLLTGIIEEIIEEGQLIPELPIMQLDSKELQYRRESSLPTAQYVDIGEEIVSATPADFINVAVQLKRVIGQWDLDAFVRDTYKNPNDIRALAISQCRKGVMRFMESELVYGLGTPRVAGSGGEELQIMGMHHLLNDASMAAQRIYQGASATTGGALSLMNLDKLIDTVKPKPDIMLMNFQLWRRFQAVGRGEQGITVPLIQQVPRGDDLAPVSNYYRGVRIVRSDYLLQTELSAASKYSAKTGGYTSSIFAIKFGSVEEGGLCLVTGSPMFELVGFDNLETKDAERFRLKWYVNQALGSTKSIARIDGILDAPIVA